MILKEVHIPGLQEVISEILRYECMYLCVQLIMIVVLGRQTVLILSPKYWPVLCQLPALSFLSSDIVSFNMYSVTGLHINFFET